MIQKIPNLGLGIGWRPELAVAIERRRDLGFVEIIAENVDPKSPSKALLQLRDRGIAVIPHGISLSLAGADPIDLRRVERLAKLAEVFGSPLVSEHIAFVRAGEIEAGHLLPVPRTTQSLDVLAENVQKAKKHLPVPLALENISATFSWPGQQMDEGEFLAKAVASTNCLLLLDIANVYANQRNFGGDVATLLRDVPKDRLAYVHVGGGEEREGFYFDTHAHAVSDGVIQLLAELCKIARPHGVMLERDDQFPSEQELNDELTRIGRAAGILP